ncbi:MAG TPA: MMPL family transporter, partial [Pseudolysinimonas sp.]
MKIFAGPVARRLTAWVTIAIALVGTAAVFALVSAPADDSFPASGLPASTESAQVAALLDEGPSADATVAILVFDRAGDALTEADTAAVAAAAARLAELSTVPQAVRPVPSDDGQAALITVPLSRSDVEADVAAAADELRAAAAEGLPDGLRARLTGPVGFQADISNAFAGADFRLLLVTVIVVGVLLIITYRSPVLWIVPLVVVGVADGVARTIVAALGPALGFTIDPSVAGIQSVLVFGAGTNYALLLVARYREELLRQPDRFAAMRLAV